MTGFSQGLQQHAQQQQQAIAVLEKLAQRLQVPPTDGADGEMTAAAMSGVIATAHQQVQHIGNTLRQGNFRIVVLGDMKRGKSTVLNALLGEPLLPSDVNPCTALLTVIRYGETPQVTLHYHDERPPKNLDFATFKREYTIPPETARQLVEKDEAAFPDISHAVVAYPLPWLEAGIELVDTPGLNDTEARNQQVLSYLNEAQAVLFVLSATQPMTLDERRYLQNYLAHRGLTVFFLINGFDRIRAGLVNPEDGVAVAEAEDKIRATFRSALADVLPAAAYPQRVFETSALEALRQRISGIPLESTHFAPFLNALQQFLVEERGQASLARAVMLTQQAQRSVAASVARQVPLMDDSLAEIEAKVASVQRDFERLEGICDQYRQLIRTSCDRTATDLSNDFKTYLISLSDSFEQDFTDAQPNLEFLEFLQR
ncbi:MAG: dynamin family protein, partial [Cyanobacteria bacterium J06632_22]